MEKRCTAVIVAAGSAQRMQGIDKLLAPLCGTPVLLHTVRALASCEKIAQIVIVTRAELVPTVQTLCAQEAKVCHVVAGGSTRAESVMNGLRFVQTPLVAIHDGARPLVAVQVVEAAIAAAEVCGAAAPAVRVHDTVKVAQDGFVTATPDRSTLFAVQTPQVFETVRICAALTAAQAQRLALTDDCSAVEAAGMMVRLTAGSEENLKITTPIDLVFAEAIMKRRNIP